MKDKQFEKILYLELSSQQQDDIDSFCHKIRVGKAAQATNDFYDYVQGLKF